MLLPEAFVKRTTNLLGDEFLQLEKSLSDAPSLSIRVNNKMDYCPSNERVPWCETGFYLNERPLFTADPLFHAGVYYVQEASSMFLCQAVRQHFPQARNVLDLCAAPGGKSTLLSQFLPETSLLVSNEIIRSRAYILAENLIKWGNPNVFVSNNQPREFKNMAGFFDAIIVDAPCSGEGMFRKDAGAIREWSEYNVGMCVNRQHEIVSDVWDSLKEGGILVYSTCTFNREENEENVEWICRELGAETLTLDFPANSGIVAGSEGYRFYPHRVQGEGFFLSVMRKTAGSTATKIKNDIPKTTRGITPDSIKPLALLEPSRWAYFQENNLVKAYEKDKVNEFRHLSRHLTCMHSGISIGEIKGKDTIPAAALALSKKLNREHIPAVDVDYETAISFLRKEAIQLPETTRGYVLVCYKGQALGWVKNVGNRCNNLYPQEWRIRMKL